MKHWLMKSEPDVFSIDHLKKEPSKTACWDGVRNYQARNFMRDDMKKGDLVLFYHSSCKVPGVVGVAKVVKESYPDHTSWDKNSPYFDEKSSPENPRWYMVDIKFVKKFKNIVTLKKIKELKGLQNMKLIQKGNRLSIMPITEKEFKIISDLGERT